MSYRRVLNLVCLLLVVSVVLGCQATPTPTPAPTAVPATAVPPTAVPATAVPPTAVPATATAAPKAEAPAAVLTVMGKAMALKDLQALPQVTSDVSGTKYTGVRFVDVLKAANVQVAYIAMVAGDGYTANVAVADITEACLLAYNATNGVDAVMPGLSKGLSVRGVVQIKEGAKPAPTTAPTVAAAPTIAVPKRETGRLILATTTSTADSGLLSFILPDFEKKFGVKVDVVAVGTGQAIEIGSKGDADVLLVHDRAREDKFVKDGFARERFDVMYNDYIVLGPKADPAKGVGLASTVEVFKAVAAAKAPFASRGDGSGTNAKEKSLWASAGITPTKDLGWYKSLGQGMGETLLTSNEMGAYTLADRGTYLSMKDKLTNLIVVMGGNNISENKDKGLLNPYGVMAVDPTKFPAARFDLAMQFVTWITSVDTQKVVGTYGVDKYGGALFYASSAEWKKANP